jgi:cell division protein FtsB
MNVLEVLLAPLRAVQEALANVGWDRPSTRLGISFLVASAVFFLANFADKAWLSYQVAQEKQQQMATIQQTEQQIAQLKATLNNLHSRSYYKQAARQYGYVMPGDIQIEIQKSVAEPQGVAQQGNVPTPVPTSTHDSVLRRVLQAVVPGI